MLLKLSRVLNLFSPDRAELSVRDIAKPFKWPKSTAYRILSRIQAIGFLDRDERTGLYRLGIRLAIYGELARHSTSLQRIVAPVLHRLSATTSETATLMLLNGQEGVTVDVVESFQPLMLPGLLGGRMPLHATAGGKALLAWASPSRLETLLRPPFERFTQTTITDPTELMRELEKSRKRGYTIVNGEHVDNVVGVGVPIHDHQGGVPAALTVAGPRQRATAKLEMMAAAAAVAAAAVSATLGYGAHSTPDGGSDGAVGRRGLGAKRATAGFRRVASGQPKVVSPAPPRPRSRPAR
jgi:DNA-binding IclR family transcriptional regulator